jgi:hypothetical protein
MPKVRVKKVRRRKKRTTKKEKKGSASTCGSSKRFVVMLAVLCVGTVTRTVLFTHHHVHHSGDNDTNEDGTSVFGPFLTDTMRKLGMLSNSADKQSSSSGSLRGGNKPEVTSEKTAVSKLMLEEAVAKANIAKADFLKSVRGPPDTAPPKVTAQATESAKAESPPAAAASITSVAPAPTPQVTKSASITDSDSAPARVASKDNAVITPTATAVSPVASAESDSELCASMAKRHRVTIGSSWGTLDGTQKAWWRRKNCDQALLTHHATQRHRDTTTRAHGVSGSTLIGIDRKKTRASQKAREAAGVVATMPTPKPTEPKTILASVAESLFGRKKTNVNVKPDPEARYRPTDPVQCKLLRNKHHVIIDQTWGSLPKPLQVGL